MSSDVLVLGGPAAGKTHYTGQLVIRMRRNRHGAVALRPGGADDLRKFEEVLRCLEEGRAAGHTPANTWSGMQCDLVVDERPAGTIVWPDYGGERLDALLASRSVSSEWRAALERSSGWMLFIRLSQVTTQQDLLSRPPSENAGVAAAKSFFPEPAAGDGSRHDVQVRYVELLQLLLCAAGYATDRRLNKPKLCIALSCYDELGHPHQTPAMELRQRMPLMYAFCASNWNASAWSVWGVSALGRALQPERVDDDFASKGPENFGYVVHPSATAHDSDLTAPLSWLLQ